MVYTIKFYLQQKEKGKSKKTKNQKQENNVLKAKSKKLNMEHEKCNIKMSVESKCWY